MTTTTLKHFQSHTHKTSNFCIPDHLADGAQDLQRRVAGLHHRQDGLVARQAHPGGGQVLWKPHIVFQGQLRKTFHRALSLLLKKRTSDHSERYKLVPGGDEHPAV